MKNTPKLLAVSLAFASALGGCAGSTATNPASGSLGAGGNAALRVHAPPVIDGIAGEFAGTVTDSLAGKGKAEFRLSQIAGGGAGGSMKLTFGRLGKASSALALDASNAKNINGNAVALFGSDSPCTLTISAKFNRKTYTLSGTYKAFNNCASGQKGTFSAKERCYYVVAKPVANGVRPRTFPKTC